MIFVLSFVILAVGPWPCVDKAAKNPPSTTVPPLFLRELRDEVRENVGQVEDAYRASRIRWGNSSVIISFGLNRVFMPFTKLRRSGTSTSTLLPTKRSACMPSRTSFSASFSAKKFHQRVCRRIAPHKTARMTVGLSSWSLITSRYDLLILPEKVRSIGLGRGAGVG
jgi:hypothetical protein